MAILNAKQLSAKIKSIKGNSTKLRDAIQEALISCAYYAIKDGDAGSFNRLLDAVGTNTRIKGITQWAETWGCVRVKDEKFVINKTARDEMAVSNESDFAQHEDMMRAAVPWYDMTPKEKAVSIFDAEHYLQGVLNKLDKEGETELVKYIMDAITSYNNAEAIRELEADHIERLAA